jgi:excisionase family DNA binding protein
MTDSQGEEDMNKRLRLPEVAARLGVHPSSLQRWCIQGKGPEHLKTPGGTYIFRAEDVEAWLASLRPTPQPGDPEPRKDVKR